MSIDNGQMTSITEETINPDTGVDPAIKGGVIRSPFLKFENLRMGYQYGGGIAIYAHHVWFNNCRYTGAGRIWVDTVNQDEAVRSRNTSGTGAFLSHDVVLENFTVTEANQGISMIGVGNYIVRGSDVSYQNGDGMKFQGDNVLFTGNSISYVIPPQAWATAFNGPAYDCTTSSRLTFHLDTEQSASDAKANGDPDVKIRYDINWDLRNTSAPSIGAYE